MIDPITLGVAKRYTDSQRIAYSERSEIQIFEEAPIEFENYDGLIMSILSSQKISEAPDELVVVFDGAKFTCSKKEVGGNASYGNLMLVNLGEDTGEPFALAPDLDYPDPDITLFEAAANSVGTHTIGVFTVGESLKQLDQKFLPPVDSLTFNSSTEGSTKKLKMTVDDTGKVTVTDGADVNVSYGGSGGSDIVRINLTDYGMTIENESSPTQNQAELMDIIVDAVDNQKTVQLVGSHAIGTLSLKQCYSIDFRTSEEPADAVAIGFEWMMGHIYLTAYIDENSIELIVGSDGNT